MNAFLLLKDKHDTKFFLNMSEITFIKEEKDGAVFNFSNGKILKIETDIGKEVLRYIIANAIRDEDLSEAEKAHIYKELVSFAGFVTIIKV